MEKTTSPRAEIWYLFHSGFAIRTARYFLIFDYFPGPDSPLEGNLEQGLLSLEMMREKQVVLFASHRHPDHFDKRVLTWRKQIPGIRYVLSDDIRLRGEQDASDILWVHFGNTYHWEGLSLRTLHSTDEGVAFLLEADGLTVYHAGDLNWWHWEEESDHYNKSMAGQYRKEIDSLSGLPIDLAFVPLDPRLQNAYRFGMEYFLKKVRPGMVFPMHFGDDFSVFQQLRRDAEADGWKNQVTELTHRGQHFSFNPESQSNSRPGR